MKKTGKQSIEQKIKRRINILLIAALIIVSIPLIFMYLSSYFKNNLKQLNTIAQQTSHQIDSIHQNVATFSKWVPMDKDLIYYLNCLASDTSSAYQITNLISNRLTELTGHSSGITDIILFLPEGDFSSIFMTEDELQSLKNSSWLSEIRSSGDDSAFSYINDETGKFYYYTTLDSFSNLTGEMLICTNAEELQDALDLTAGSFHHSLWLDNQNNPLEDHDFPENERIRNTFNNIHYNYFSTETVYDPTGILSVFHTDVAHWKFISYISYFDLFRQLLPLLLTILGALVCIIFITSRVLTPVIRNVTAPIIKLSQRMKSLPYSEAEPLYIHTGDEIEDLANAFNQMSAELKHHIQMLLDEQKKEETLRYGLMVSQINPHFIYNTMNTINYLARKERTGDIVVINSALIHIMKDCLRINEFSVFDTLQNEIHVTKEYLTIQNYRYSSEVEVIWDVDETLLERNIPKQLLQPIIENSLIHGFLAIEEEELPCSFFPRITISVFAVSHRSGVCIRIEDNGAGINIEDYKKLCEQLDSVDNSEETRGKHIGLANIKWRLSYLLNDRQDLDISPASPHGTIVTIHLYDD